MEHIQHIDLLMQLYYYSQRVLVSIVTMVILMLRSQVERLVWVDGLEAELVSWGMVVGNPGGLTEGRSQWPEGGAGSPAWLGGRKGPGGGAGQLG